MWSAGPQLGVNLLRLSLQEARHHLDNFVDEFKNCGTRCPKKVVDNEAGNHRSKTDEKTTFTL